MRCNLPAMLPTADSIGIEHRRSLQETLDEIERELILDALKASRGNIAKAARSLGVSERVMGLRVRKYGIQARQFRTSM